MQGRRAGRGLGPLMDILRVAGRLGLVLLVGVAMSLVVSPARAQAPAVTLTVDAGYDGACRDDGWCPVRVLVESAGGEVEGELQVVTHPDGLADEVDLYVQAVTLAGPSRKAYSFVVPVELGRNHIRATLVGAGLEGVTVETEATGVANGRPLVAVCSESPSALRFLATIIVDGQPVERLSITPDMIPSEPLGLDALDVLVLTSVDSASLRTGQREAIGTWISMGGHLVVTGGADAARTAAGVAHLLPVELVGAVRSLTSLEALSDWLGISVQGRGPHAAAASRLRDGQALATQDETVLLADRQQGAGRVTFVGLDGELETIPDEVREQFWQTLLTSHVTVRWPTMLADPDSYSDPAADAVEVIPGLRLPSLLYLLPFALLYILLVGPINYVVLRVLDRRVLAWFTIPAFILVFTAGAYVTGRLMRGSRPIIHRLAVVTVPAGVDRGRVEELVGVFSPRRTRYDLSLAGAGVTGMRGQMEGAALARGGRFEQRAGGLAVSDMRVDVGSISPFMTTGFAGVEPPTADLHIESSGATNDMVIAGTVRAGAQGLEDAYLLAGGWTQDLGDMAPGAEAEVRVHVSVASALSPGLAGGSGQDVAETIVGTGFWEDDEKYRRYRLVEAAFPAQRGLPPGVYLIGWTSLAEERVTEQQVSGDVVPLPVAVDDKSFDVRALGLHIYQLPVADEIGRDVLRIPDGLMRWSQEQGSDVDVQPSGELALMPRGEVIYRIRPWDGVSLEAVSQIIIDVSEGRSTSGEIMVSLWNWRTNQWVELGGWGRHIVDDAAPFVRAPDAEMRLRIEGDSSATVNLGRLAISLQGRGAGGE